MELLRAKTIEILVPISANHLEMTPGEIQNVLQVHRFQLIVNVETKRRSFYILQH